MEDVNIETFYDFKTFNEDNTDIDDTVDPDFPNVDIFLTRKYLQMKLKKLYV